MPLPVRRHLLYIAFSIATAILLFFQLVCGARDRWCSAMAGMVTFDDELPLPSGLLLCMGKEQVQVNITQHQYRLQNRKPLLYHKTLSALSKNTVF